MSPTSESENWYVLVICNYATRYPEAIPLRIIDTENIAEELIQLFAQVGVPEEILTDQGSKLKSQLLKERLGQINTIFAVCILGSISSNYWVFTF